MDTKHTPGPWKMVSSVHFETGLTYVSVQPVNSDPVAEKPLAMANGEYHVCRMSHTAARHRIDLYEANARLISAAPDLLEVVRLFQGMGWRLEDDAHGIEIRRRALAAIQKATSRTSLEGRS